MEKLKSLKNYFIQPSNEYRCVHCGYPVRELYKTYSPTIQKLSECEKCSKIADEFVEFDNLFIVIDLILLSSQAQRHVLYNTTCKNLYKILMVITFLEAYCLFRENFNKFEDKSDLLYLEKGFYLSTIQVMLSNITFFTMIRIVSGWSDNKEYRSKSLTMDLFRGFMLASIAKFFFLPIVIWRENISGLNAGVHLVIVIGYFLISLIYIHSTITGCSRKASAATILLAFLCNKYFWSGGSNARFSL